MAQKLNIVIGLLTLIIISSGVVYIQFTDKAKMRIDEDKATFYVPNENYPWLWSVSGREYDRLFEGTSLKNRNRNGIIIETIFRNESDSYISRDGILVNDLKIFSQQEFDNLSLGDVEISRYTPYQIGAKIVHKYKYNGNIKDINLFPIQGTVEIYNASGLFYRYTVDDLTGTGEKRKLNGTTKLSFGKNMDVEFEPNYRWAWIGYPYGSDSFSAQYEITGNYVKYNFRLFDPVPTQGTPILNTTNPATNDTNQNLTAYNTSTADADGDRVKSIFNWYVNGSSITLLNSPFEGVNGTTENNTWDYSPLHINSTVHNAVWQANGGHDGGGAYQFDGSSAYINYGNTYNQYLADGTGITISAWINISWSSYSRMVIAEQTRSGFTKTLYTLWLDDGTPGDGEPRLFFTVENSSFSLNVVEGTGILPYPNTWVHVVGRYNSSAGTASIWVNGKMNASITGVGSSLASATSGEFTIGAGQSGASQTQYFNGYVDDLQVFNRTLSSEEIWNLYSNKTDEIASSETKVGQNWTVEITPNDGSNDGIAQLSNQVLIKEAGPSDSCTYTSGDWNVDCSDNCDITSNVDLGGNALTITGTGTFLAEANITGCGSHFEQGTDSNNMCVVVETGTICEN